jgi:hypothetical protein
MSGSDRNAMPKMFSNSRRIIGLIFVLDWFCDMFQSECVARPNDPKLSDCPGRCAGCGRGSVRIRAREVMCLFMVLVGGVVCLDCGERKWSGAT